MTAFRKYFNLILVTVVFAGLLLLFKFGVVEPTRYSLLNAFTETIKKYTPLRVDLSYIALNRGFGLDGNRPELWR